MRYASLGLGILLLAGAAVHQAVAEVQLEVGRTGSRDDYLCWGNVEAKVRWDGQGTNPGKVLLRSVSSAGSGRVGFAAGAAPTVRLEELNVELPSNGSWVTFKVFGLSASTNDKDVKISAAGNSGAEIASLPVMVRVRKDAEELTTAERDRFLDAFVKAAKKNNQFAKYWGIHTDAVQLAHQYAFLPWHRVFLIEFERELQAEDPSVALPYWAFDKVAPNLFSPDFIGIVSDGSSNPKIVSFSSTNPLANWRLTDPRVTPLTRARNGSVNVDSRINKSFMAETTEGAARDAIWAPYHGFPHTFINGLLGDIERSPADPLFFLLHANVDRAWAAWQRHYGAFDRQKAAYYPLQGSFPGAGEAIFGNYENDTMWPWDGIERPDAPVSETIGTIILPPNPGPSDGLSTTPKVGDTLDYLGMLQDASNAGFCYDDIPYGQGDVPDFPLSSAQP